MKPAHILKSDVLDLLFENRNKQYGAYVLRREYDIRLIKSLGIMILLTGTLLLLSFTFKKESKTAACIAVTLPPDMILRAAPHEAKPAGQQQIAFKKTGMKKTSVFIAKQCSVMLSRPVITDDKKIIRTDASVQTHVVAPAVAENKANASDVKTIETGGSSLESGTVSAATGNSNGVSDAVSMPAETADIMPSFPGGKAALEAYLRKHIHGPESDEQEETVLVQVQFVVKADGSVADLKVIKSGGDAFDEAVLEAIEKMPRWNPGKMHGKEVAVYYVVPVNFDPQR